MSEIDQSLRTWADDLSTKYGHQIINSSVYAGIVTDSFMKDPLCAFQLGLAILHEKPIALIVDKNCVIPAGLVKVATVIECVDFKNPEDMQRASEAIANMARGR